MTTLNACWCCTLRAGAKILAWWNLVGALFTIYIAYDAFKVLAKSSESYPSGYNIAWNGSEDNTWRNILFVVVVLEVIIKFALCYLLFSGIYARRPENLKKYCIAVAVFLVMFNISNIYEVNKKSNEKQDILKDLVVWVVYDAIEIYCLLCILSYNQVLKEEEGTDDDRERSLPLYFRAPQMPVDDSVNNPGPTQDQRQV